MRKVINADWVFLGNSGLGEGLQICNLENQAGKGMQERGGKEMNI
jgi:hypothetical protein